MEKFSQREAERRLRDFERVWSRVRGQEVPGETAERCGVKLMPRRPCGRRQCAGDGRRGRLPDGAQNAKLRRP